MKLIPESSAFDVVNTALNFDTVDGTLIGRLESYSCKLVGDEKALYKKFSRSEDAGMSQLQALSPPRYDTTPFEGPYYTTLSRSLSSSDSAQQQSGQPCTVVSCSLPIASSIPSRGVGVGGLNTSCSSVSSTGSQHLDHAFADAGEQEDKIVRKTLFYLVSTLNAAFYPDYDFSNTTSKEFSMEHSLQHVMLRVERQLNMVSHSQLAALPERIWAAVDEAIHLNDCDIYTYNPDENSDPYSDDGCVWSFNYFFYNPRLKRIVFFSCRLMSPLAIEVNSLLADSLDYYMDSDVEFDD